jgi:hypothetical protein
VVRCRVGDGRAIELERAYIIGAAEIARCPRWSNASSCFPVNAGLFAKSATLGVGAPFVPEWEYPCFFQTARQRSTCAIELLLVGVAVDITARVTHYDAVGQRAASQQRDARACIIAVRNR